MRATMLAVAPGGRASRVATAFTPIDSTRQRSGGEGPLNLVTPVRAEPTFARGDPIEGADHEEGHRPVA